MLLAWAIHGPIGQGRAFLAAMQRDAQLKLAMNDLGDVQAGFPDRPLSRVLHLSGPAGIIAQNDAVKLLAGLPGSAGVVWGDGDAVALADARGAGESAETKSFIVALPEPAKPPEVKPADKPAESVALAAAPPPPEPVSAPEPATKPAPPPRRAAEPAPERIAPPRPTPRPVASPAAFSGNVPPMMVVTASGALGTCQRAVNSAIDDRVMIFQPGSAWLNATTQAIIRDVAKALKGCDGYKLEIAGHSDNAGDEGINRLMSEERAKRVRDALIEKGVAGARLIAKGYGSTRPIRAGQASDPANRRITFLISGAEA